MITFSLQSGSHGNAYYVETAGVRLLVDCGLTGKKATERLAVYGVPAASIDAILVTHDHRDHLRGVGVMTRRYGMPVYMTRGASRLSARRGVGRIDDALREVEPGATLRFGSTTVESIRTPHDGADTVAYIIEDEDGSRLGVFTDLGHPFPGLRERIATCDAVYLESNHDADMLRWGPYPAALKARIAGPHGHLSNLESANLVRDALAGSERRLGLVVHCHLSEHNNTPQVADETHRRVLGDDVRLGLARRGGVSARYHVTVGGA